MMACPKSYKQIINGIVSIPRSCIGMSRYYFSFACLRYIRHLNINASSLKLSTLYPTEESLAAWIYFSECSNHVKRRWDYRKSLQEGRGISVIDSKESLPKDISLTTTRITAKTDGNGNDRWVWIYLRPEDYIWRNFQWTFKCKRKSPFKELQFAFRYRDFYNRYRFRHEDGRFHFDIVKNGKFINGVASTWFPMELDHEYKIAIVAVGRYFALQVNGQNIIDAIDWHNHFPEGSVAVIFWEDNGKTPIDVEVNNILVEELTV